MSENARLDVRFSIRREAPLDDIETLLAAGGSTITDSVLFDHVDVGAGARVHRAILDKNVVLEPGATVGVDRERDLARGFTVTDSGLTVVAKGIRVTA